MFRGVHHISMDSKGRTALPARQRERLMAVCGGQLVATIDLDSHCLAVYPLHVWEELERQIQALPNSASHKRVKRLLIGYASDLEFDGNGRVLMPASLREYAELGNKLVLIGQGNKFELWSEANWATEQEESMADLKTDVSRSAEFLSIPL
ncbi:MAG: division/cell wall cluster transcriptional repressor MraZ [Pseudomonadales bacterium]